MPVVLATICLAGCGGDDEGSGSGGRVGPAPETVGTLSEQSAGEPVVRDATAIRTALESGRADEAVGGICGLIDRAGRTNTARGAELVRAELSGLVAMLERSEPGVRVRVEALSLETRTGSAMRELGLSVLGEQLRLCRALRTDLARSGSAWAALLRWGKANNARIRRNRAELARLRRTMPREEWAALEEAAGEIFGTP